MKITAVSARVCALQAFEGMFAALHMACRTLLQLLSVVAGITDVLMAELTFHRSLLVGMLEANVMEKVVFRSRKDRAERGL